MVSTIFKVHHTTLFRRVIFLFIANIFSQFMFFDVSTTLSNLYDY